ncbi:MAG: hypothetical protein NUV47_03475 [Patescibacteria group bacterium]|nr:hypothetical protein [Patescibacteria group bacterium]
MTTKLSPKAFNKLKEILRKDFGKEYLAKLDDKTINDIGVKLLKLTGIALKREIRLMKEKNELNTL